MILRSKRIYYKNVYMIIGVSIIFLVLVMFFTILKKSSNSIINVSKVIINNTIIDTINNNIKASLLKKYKVNDLIIINYNNNEVYNIDYNLENSYSLLADIKNGISDNFSFDYIEKNNYVYNYSNDILNVKVPFYNYLGNIDLSGISPKVNARINMVKVINGSVKTRVSNYGINSLKVDLYLNISVVSNIVVPFDSSDINTSFDILIASKVISGKIPNYYSNGMFSESDMFNFVDDK